MSEQTFSMSLKITQEIANAIAQTKHFWPIFQKGMHGLVGHVDTAVGSITIYILIPNGYPKVPPIIDAPVQEKILEKLRRKLWKGDLPSFIQNVVKSLKNFPERYFYRWIVERETKALIDMGYKINQTGILVIERAKNGKKVRITIDFHDYSHPPKITCEGIKLSQLHSLEGWNDECHIIDVVREIEEYLSSRGYINVDRIIISIAKPKIYFEAPLGAIIRVYGPLEKVSRFYGILAGKIKATKRIFVGGKENPTLIITLPSLVTTLNQKVRVDKAISQRLLHLGRNVKINEIRELLNVAAVPYRAKIIDLTEGEKRRVAIIIGAMINIHMSLLTSPLRGLPTADAIRVERLIRHLALAKNHTFLIYGDDIKADRFLILDSTGKQLAYGTMAELMSEFNVNPVAIRIRFSRTTSLDIIKKVKGVRIIVPEIEGEIYKLFISGSIKDVIENILRIAIDEIYAIEQVPVSITDYMLLKERLKRKRRKR